MPAVCLVACLVVQAACSGASRLPAELSDEEFWALATTLSEPDGAFTHSDNLVSNELSFVHVLRLLRVQGGVYVGVGPEQNFSYIARLVPDMAFIVDIRRENRNLHLLYKALFEISLDRGDFVMRLFSRVPGAAPTSSASVAALFEALAAATPSFDRFEETRRLVRARLLEGRRLPLGSADLEWIDYALSAFRIDGPEVHYYGRGRAGQPTAPSYRQLMTATDVFGQPRSYLASEEAFAFVKRLHSRNLIVPVIGNFAGPTTIRQIGDYARARGARVMAFYASNVGVYLSKPQALAFCANLATLPAEASTRFIESKTVKSLRQELDGCVPATTAR